MASFRVQQRQDHAGGAVDLDVKKGGEIGGEVPHVGAYVGVHSKDGELRGMVRFVGETEFKPGCWVGVELESNAGKNDGTVGGTRYFSCPPNRGLFVRPAMLRLIGKQHGGEDASMRDADLEEHKDMEIADDEASDQRGVFEVAARTFIFNKNSKEWIELGCGSTALDWRHPSGKVHIRLADTSSRLCVDHLVDPNTKIEATIVTQQSWVFRACRHADPTIKDVLCLQFNTVAVARDFVSSFEASRAAISAKGGAQARKSKHGNEPEEATRVMRRRLTVSGGDPHLDGHKQGAHLDTDSPKPTTPKMLRSGEVGQWTAAAGAAAPLHIRAYSGVSRKGVAPYNPDKQNQDSMIMLQLPHNGFCNGELLLACFDGHGAEGHSVSRYMRDRLPKLLATSPKFSQDEHTGDVLADAMLTAEKEIIADRSVDTTLSGTTAVVCVLRGNKLHVANIGDSRIVKGKKNKNNTRVLSEDLSVDHKPDDERERERIVNTGGRVFAMKYDDGIDGPARVWLSYADMPGLAMSRSICDTVGKEAGVISNAELFTHELQPGRDSFVILATDGLWEFMSSQEVVDIVQRHAEAADTRSAITELIRESNRRWRLEEPVIDDTTIVLAYLGTDADAQAP